MKRTSAITRAAVLSLAALALASAYARTYDFSEGKWNRNEFFEPRNAKWDRGSPVMQLPDCIMNACDPSWSDEELFKRHQIDVFSSLILTNRFRGDVTFSSRMSFDHRMAPSLVIAGECFTDSRGRKALGDFYEIVLYDEGINVWRHRGIKSGKPEVKKVAYATHAFQKRTQYEFRAVVKRKRAHGGRMTTDIEVSAGGVSVGFHDDTVPDVFYIGVLGSEGRCRFYDFKVDDAAFAAASSATSGELSFGLPFKDGAVLQRGRRVPVWGRAKPGEQVRVKYGGATAKATADKSGAWRAELPAMCATSAPLPLMASTDSASVCVDDVVVGEVWLCSGQSNMAQALVDGRRPRYRDGIGSMGAQATDKPLVRYLETPVPAAGWRRFTPEFLSSGRRSSIAVHYALELHEKLGVPVGVVVAAVGGCNIDSFLPESGRPADLDSRLLLDVYPYALRGALWYQGETNVSLGEIAEYGVKMRRLYDRWREMFANPGLRFYYVQLAPFARGKVKRKRKDGTEWTFDYDEAFPKFLCVQAAFEKSEPNAAMTVVNDLGCVDDIHPNEKWLVAKRLALHALKRDYGFEGVEDRSPEPTSATASSNVVKVVFSHARGLYAYQRGRGFSSELPFELAGADGVWRPARVLNFGAKKWAEDGIFDGNVIELAADGVDTPAKVRYAWKRPWEGVVYSDVDLPLATFEMDVARSPALLVENPTTSPFKDGETVVFWGDSITQQAKWTRFLTDFYHTRYPERNIKYRNAGIAGNSFGGGIRQLPLDVTPWKPTTIVTMFGMNDSAAAPRPEKYHPGWPSNDVERARLRKRVDGGYAIDARNALAEIRKQCGEATRIVMMTPSIYDSTARAPKGEPVNDGWNTTLGESGRKLIEGYENGKWELVDIWAPMTAFNNRQQRVNPKFSIVSNQERVHPDDRGAYFMAQRILMAQGVDHTVSKIAFDAGRGMVAEARKADVSGVGRIDGGWEMTVLEKSLPFPTAKTAQEVACRSSWGEGYAPDVGINYEWFSATGLAKGVWELRVDGELVWRGTDGEFAFGVNLGKNPDTPQMAHAKKVAEANRLRQEREAYLRALASLRWWLRMKIDDPDDVSKAAKWLEENPNQKGGLFGRGQYLKEYMVDWPRRGEIYAELDAMDAEIAKLRQPVPHKWTLRQVESGERDYVPAKKVTEKVELFNGRDLSGWYKYLSGRGRDNDPLGVFSVKDGVISIHGLSAGCITTKEAYRDYRCQVEYRWVGKSYIGRTWKTHDSGFLFHSQGPDGMYHGTWKWSFEANMIQSRTPDLITVVLRGYAVPPEAYTYRATVDVDGDDVWTPGGRPTSCENHGHWHNKFTPVPWIDCKDNPTVPPEKPMGEWNLLEVVAVGDRAEFFLNGVKTLEAYGLNPTEGQLQIQSEGSDCEVRRVTLLPAN